jgi:hypothetical protein
MDFDLFLHFGGQIVEFVGIDFGTALYDQVGLFA